MGSSPEDGTRSTEAGTHAATAGCGKTPALRDGTHTIQSGGGQRSFILDIPDRYDNTHPHRLVFGFHWWGATADDVATGRTVERGTWAYYGLQRLAGDSTIFVAPQGIDNAWANSGGQDVTFVDDMIAMIEQDLCIETTQRFALGFSYGGSMSHALACARPDVFRAVAAYGAPGQVSGCSGGTRPVAYFGAHGIRDSVAGIASGRSLRDRFVRNNGCTAQSPPEPAQGSLTHITTAYSGCRDGYPVVWAAFDEGHIAAPQDGAAGDSGSRTWLPGETWNFFTQFGDGTDPGDDQAPTVPGTPAVSAVTATSATLNWAVSSDNVGVTGYDVVRVSGGAETTVASSATNRVTVTGLSPATAYTFAVYARDAAGNRSARSATVTVTTEETTAGSCGVGYRVVNDWGGGFQGEIVIRNTGTAALTGWTLAFDFTAGQAVTQMWGGTPAQSGGTVSVTPVDWTRTIPAGGSVTVGFIGTRGGTNPAPAAFTLNGETCALA
nr:cellulose binding domain-containing protein [Streptomyces sp. YIM 98790]